MSDTRQRNYTSRFYVTQAHGKVEWRPEIRRLKPDAVPHARLSLTFTLSHWFLPYNQIQIIQLENANMLALYSNCVYLFDLFPSPVIPRASANLCLLNDGVVPRSHRNHCSHNDSRKTIFDALQCGILASLALGEKDGCSPLKVCTFAN